MYILRARMLNYFNLLAIVSKYGFIVLIYSLSVYLMNYYLLSCGMDGSLALAIGVYSLDKSPQIQANILLI